jgi:Endosomal/lysosomal potassium channel TMEM175
MIRQRMMDGRTVEANGFRWRGREVSRLEALSDAVFGFAITLLVVSLEVPRTATELFAAMRGMISFAACFALLFMVWFHQYRFFRRYGLNDTVTVVLNGVLLFVIVFFVYPLKFVFGILLGAIMGQQPWAQRPDGLTPVLSMDQWPAVMMIFAAGYVAVFGLFALLHLHAYRRRDVLELNALEQFDTLDNVGETGVHVVIGLLSIALATAGQPLLAGSIFWLIGPAAWGHAVWSARRRKALAAGLDAGVVETGDGVPAGT